MHKAKEPWYMKYDKLVYSKRWLVLTIKICFDRAVRKTFKHINSVDLLKIILLANKYYNINFLAEKNQLWYSPWTKPGSEHFY